MNDTVDIETFLHGFKERPLLALVSLAIWYVTQHLGTGSKFPITVPDRYKPLVAAVLGALAGVTDKIVNASTWQEAAAVALYSSMGAVLFHSFGIKLALGKGSGAGVPSAMKTEAAVATETVKKRITIPPAAGGMVFLLLLGCEAVRAAPVFSALDAIGRSAAQVLGYCEEHLPPGDAQLKAAKAAAAARRFDEVFQLARPMLERIVESGEPVPQIVADEVMKGAMAAQAIQSGLMALHGPGKFAPAGDVGTP